MTQITLKEVKYIDVTPRFLATLFTEMTHDEQAEFFEELTTTWDSVDWDNQMYAVRKELSQEALERIRMIYGSH